jgi:Iron-containing redox enzyme
MSTPAAIQDLDAIPPNMAHALVEILPRVELPGYLRFLDTMFHYTRDSGARLVEAGEQASDPALASFYGELARDEAHHYRLAEADLASFGRTPSAEPPPPVRDFQAFWAAPVREREQVRLGALFVLEGVAAHLGEPVRLALQRLGLGPSSARFVLVHLQADAEHGAACRAHALRLAAMAPEPLLAGARAAAPLWIAMHRCLVDDGSGGV